MGSFHCVTASCGKVVYREYLPPIICYRYEGEDWQEIEGDDFSIEQEEGQCDTNYLVKGRTAKNGVSYCGGERFTSTELVNNWEITTTGKVIGIKSRLHQTRSRFETLPDGRCNTFNKVGTIGFMFAYLAWENQVKESDGGLIYFYDNHALESITVIDSIETANGMPDDCGDFILTITLNDEIVHSEKRKDVPEIRKLGCRLSDVYKEIKIDKTPYLSAIEVLEFARDAEKINGVPFPVPVPEVIPDECLNIYRAELFDPLPDGDTQSENEPVFGDYIGQICSAKSCPRPKYEVICDCEDDCDSCPDGTCEMECEGVICCINTSTGKVVKEIPIDSYCGGNS